MLLQMIHSWRNQGNYLQLLLILRLFKDLIFNRLIQQAYRKKYSILLKTKNRKKWRIKISLVKIFLKQLNLCLKQRIKLHKKLRQKKNSKICQHLQLQIKFSQKNWTITYKVVVSLLTLLLRILFQVTLSLHLLIASLLSMLAQVF